MIAFFLSALLLLGGSWFFLDDMLQQQVTDWQSRKVGGLGYSLVVVGLLASDLLLPIPSSAVITHAGIRLGIAAATFVGTLGLTLGGMLGYFAARWAGAKFAESRISRTDREFVGRMTENWGSFIIVIFRPVPILAEATVFLLGIGQMKMATMVSWLMISNLFVSLFFAAFGVWATEQGMNELTTLGLSMIIPVCLLVIVKVVQTKLR